MSIPPLTPMGSTTVAGYIANRWPRIRQRPEVAHAGDWIEPRGLYVQPSRRGHVIALIGRDRHERYRVRWNEHHESTLYPADEATITSRRRRARHADV